MHREKNHRQTTPHILQLFECRLSPSGQRQIQHQHAHELLTARERQVFVLLLEGKRPAEIVSELHVSPSTVSTHIQHIKKKLGVQSVVEMVKYAFRAGILD
jgi:DNA-binding CsgD family transcriptional regulator